MTGPTTLAALMAAEPATVAEMRARWRAAAYEVGAHIQACEICQPQTGGRAVRNACAEYGRVDAAERDAWTAYEQARALEAGHGG